ncbi:MAG TPA: hypothetical protein VMZ03_03865 [Chitinophagaceae bacterium]|nr:hypothetical protein [Chitinophagaceae bacterium]
MDQFIPFEHVRFNATWAATKTEKEFVDHEKHHGLTDAQLKEAHKLCKEAVKPTKADLPIS